MIIISDLSLKKEMEAQVVSVLGPRSETQDLDLNRILLHTFPTITPLAA